MCRFTLHYARTHHFAYVNAIDNKELFLFKKKNSKCIYRFRCGVFDSSLTLTHSSFDLYVGFIFFFIFINFDSIGGVN